MKTPNPLAVFIFIVAILSMVVAWLEACALEPDRFVDGMKFFGGLSIALFILAAIIQIVNPKADL